MNSKFVCIMEDISGNRYSSINLADCEETIRTKLIGSNFKLISIEPTNKALTFGVDFDGTFAADPMLFKDIINAIANQGHDVVFVTGRSDDSGFGDEVRDLIYETLGTDKLFPIIFAGPEWKRKAALDAGYDVNIWIDDNPEYIAPQAQRK